MRLDVAFISPPAFFKLPTAMRLLFAVLIGASVLVDAAPSTRTPSAQGKLGQKGNTGGQKSPDEIKLENIKQQLNQSMMDKWDAQKQLLDARSELTKFKRFGNADKTVLEQLTANIKSKEKVYKEAEAKVDQLEIELALEQKKQSGSYKDWPGLAKMFAKSQYHKQRMLLNGLAGFAVATAIFFAGSLLSGKNGSISFFPRSDDHRHGHLTSPRTLSFTEMALIGVSAVAVLLAIIVFWLCYRHCTAAYEDDSEGDEEQQAKAKKKGTSMSLFSVRDSQAGLRPYSRQALSMHPSMMPHSARPSSIPPSSMRPQSTSPVSSTTERRSMLPRSSPKTTR